MNPNGQNGNQNTNSTPDTPVAPTFQAPQNNPYANQYQPVVPGQPQTQSPFQPPVQPQAQNLQMPTPQPMKPATPASAPAPAAKKSHIGDILLIIFIFIIAGAGVAGAIWCYTQYDTLNREVMADRAVKVENAKSEQAEIDNQNYEKRTAKATREFTGPSNFGALTFEYPKEWNTYISNDSSTEPTFAAYFSPDYVKPINSTNQGLEFKINSTNYDSQIKQYTSNLISSQAYSQNGLTGTIFTGKLDKREDSKVGVAVVIKINNYSATILTRDYDTYGEQFDKIISTLRSANYE